MDTQIDPVDVPFYEKLGIDPTKRTQLAYEVRQKLQLTDNQPIPPECIDVWVNVLARSSYMAEPVRQPTLGAALQGGVFWGHTRSLLKNQKEETLSFLDIRDTRAIADKFLWGKTSRDPDQFLIGSLREILCIGEICRAMPDNGFDPYVREIGPFVTEGCTAAEAENMAALAAIGPRARVGVMQLVQARRAAAAAKKATA